MFCDRRQQYQHETVHVPTFAKLYDVRVFTFRDLDISDVNRLLQAFIKLEHEIEESLPQFQELIVSLRFVPAPNASYYILTETLQSRRSTD